MPSVIINIVNEDKAKGLKNILPELREFIAKKLTGSSRELKPEEISIQVIVPKYQLPIAEIEVTIKAYSYPERVKNQDEICLEIKNFIISKNSLFSSVFVWLQLSELGHSVKE
jgi:hypothetical protein